MKIKNTFLENRLIYLEGAEGPSEVPADKTRAALDALRDKVEKGRYPEFQNPNQPKERTPFQIDPNPTEAAEFKVTNPPLCPIIATE